MQNKHRNHGKFKQRGSTLVTSIIVLILIMMMGMSAMVTSDTQLKISGNLQFEDTAANNAESGIATAESALASVGYCASIGFTADAHSAATPEQTTCSYSESMATTRFRFGTMTACSSMSERGSPLRPLRI